MAEGCYEICVINERIDNSANDFYNLRTLLINLCRTLD